jgi:hypothetical protein
MQANRLLDELILFRNTPESEFAIKVSLRRNCFLTDADNETNQYARGQMDRKLANEPKLRDILIPKTFPVGCKRPT